VVDYLEEAELARHAPHFFNDGGPAAGVPAGEVDSRDRMDRIGPGLGGLEA